MTTTTGDINGTNVTAVTAREITRQEIMGVGFAGGALLAALLVNVLMWRATYRINMLMAANLKCLGKAAFSWIGTFLQWLMLFLLVVPIGLIAVAAQQARHFMETSRVVPRPAMLSRLPTTLGDWLH
eukprot:g3734.t1